MRSPPASGWCWSAGQEPPGRIMCGRNGSSRSNADKAVTPILRQGDYPLVPDELKLLHCGDFRDDARYAFHLENLIRQLREPVPRLGKLIAVPSLPAHYLTRADHSSDFSLSAANGRTLFAQISARSCKTRRARDNGRPAGLRAW